MDIDFSGKVVVVAGGTGGLGHAVSRAFLEEGAKVVVSYRKEEEFAGLKQAVGAKSSALEGAVVDVTDEVAVGRFVGDILSRYGRVDALVNTVGGYAGGLKLWEMETKVFDAMLALNLRSGYALARAVVPAMLKQGRGSIVNVAAKAAFD
ncbi:MAG: SDR family NAD(P)-dependent oxidoreductase, partial [Edaphobacter sp.]